MISINEYQWISINEYCPLPLGPINEHHQWIRIKRGGTVAYSLGLAIEAPAIKAFSWFFIVFYGVLLFFIAFLLFFMVFHETGFQRTGYPLIFINGYPSMNISDGYPSMNINGYPVLWVPSLWASPFGSPPFRSPLFGPRGPAIGALPSNCIGPYHRGPFHRVHHQSCPS